MITDNPISKLLATPLGPDWTIDGLAEQLLDAIAAQHCEGSQEFIIDADATTDRQTSRILRPLLACLATKSAAETGMPANLYGGSLVFNRPGSTGPVWIVGQFENRPGRARVTLRPSFAPPQSSQFRLLQPEGSTDGGSHSDASQAPSARTAE